MAPAKQPQDNVTTPAEGLEKSSRARIEEMVVSLLDATETGRLQIDHERRIVGWNPGAEQIFGWKEEEIMGQPLSMLSLDGETLTGRADSISETETTGRTKSGEPVELKLWSTPMQQAENGHLLLAADLREKKFLERALLEATEREQRRIGQELHDHLCQHLLGAAFAAKALAGALDREGSSHASDLHDLARLINDSVSQVRDISRGLHPVEFDSAGLMSALQELANRVRHSVDCTFQCDQSILIENPRVALNAYRIAQEAVSCALQHTGAQHIAIILSPAGDDSVCLEVSDDGNKESELTAQPQGTVAKTLQYRAQAMGGALTFKYQPGVGNRMICTFPQVS